MKVAVLTSSRADYGIFVPLLRALQNDSYFNLEIIAFGTHLSKKHGYTLSQIEADGFKVGINLDTAPKEDTPLAISESMGATVSGFARVWSQNTYDLVICLGDRYEMFAACAASVPFNIQIAHIHGGEETLGAIDDAFRHSITHMASLHFTTTNVYRERVIALKSRAEHVYNTGALSIDNLKNLKLLTVAEMKEKFNIDLAKPSILITFHPETVSYERNGEYTDELIAALKQVKEYQLIITMPNADTMGNMVREKLNNFIAGADNAVGIESFGMLGYLSCMKHCAFMLGNTSSGFVEAAFFPKYVINLGDRQKGRIITPNIRPAKITRDEIGKAIREYSSIVLPERVDIYGDGTAALKITAILKEHYDRHS